MEHTRNHKFGRHLSTTALDREFREKHALSSTSSHHSETSSYEEPVPSILQTTSSIAASETFEFAKVANTSFSQNEENIDGHLGNAVTVYELTQGSGREIRHDGSDIPKTITEQSSDLIDDSLSFEYRSSSPAPDVARASMTGNGLPLLLRLPNKPHTEPSEIMDGGDQMYTKAIRQGRAPISPTRKQHFPVVSFANRLYMAFATNPQTRRQFLPKSQLHSLIEKTSVIEELENRMPMLSKSTREKYASMICCESALKIYQKIFAILVLIDMVPTIEDFFNEEICDAHLPLVKDSETGGLFNLRVKEDLNRRLKTFATWNMIHIRNFESYQWIILPPFFTKGERKNVKHYVLEPDRVLPFTSATDGGEFGVAEIHRGGFSRVLQAKIHPDHHDFSDPTIVEPNLRQNTFAIKCLDSLSKELFQKEVEVLKKFSGESHPHLISLLATYQQSDHYFLLFPWAEADLMNYWKEKNPQPSNSLGTIRWMAEQCQGIADGLVRLHQYDSDLLAKANQDQSQMLSPKAVPNWKNHESSIRSYGRHGDIKPENILYFRDTLKPTDKGTLKVSDFGLAEFNSRQSKSNQRASQMANSPTYRPPECDLDQRVIRQSYDIWSLGCVFLEFITWSIGGKDLLLEFAGKRASPDESLAGFNADTFFEIQDPKGKDSAAAYVKPAVVQFVKDLHSHPSCSEYLHHFLDMIMDGMLVVESEDQKSSERRMTCIQVRQKLSAWRDKYFTSLECAGPAQGPLDDYSLSPPLSQIAISA